MIRRAWSGKPFEFDGRFYELREAQHLPPPFGHVPVILGGAAKPRSLALAASFADEYNLVYVSPKVAAERATAVREACARVARPPIPVSLMTRCLVAEDRRSLAGRRDRLGRLTQGGAQSDAILDGTVPEVVERLSSYAEAGIERVMLQHLLHDDLDMVELIGREIVPRVS